MIPLLLEIAWHRAVGLLIDNVDQSGFRQTVVGRVSGILYLDNWVALLFQDGWPHLLAESTAPGGGLNPLFQVYLKGIYLINPFCGATVKAYAAG
jgi:hypothetical protein